MRTSTMLRGWVLSFVLYGLGCMAGSDGRQTQADPTETISGALTGPIQNDFEDGTTQNWFPFGSPTLANSTEQAFTGTHSLKTTNRTASFMGPSLSLTNQLTAGTTYRVSVATRLAAGEAPTTLRVTVMRSMSDGTQAFDTVVSSTPVTADAWVTMTGNYSFTATNVTGLTLYVEAASATASYYIDAFSLAQAADHLRLRGRQRRRPGSRSAARRSPTRPTWRTRARTASRRRTGPPASWARASACRASSTRGRPIR